MKNIKLTILFLFIISFSFADTTIPGGNVNGVWTLAGSPYYIDGEITIPMSDMLTIQPGVEIKFNGHYKFIVFGRILAEGTEQDSILFTIADTTGFSNIWTTDGGWHSLRFFSTIYNGQGNSILNRCRIEYAKTPHDTGTYAERRGGGIYINLSSNLEITNCEISNNVADYGAGIYCWESSPVMSGLTVKNNYAWHDAGGIMFSGANTNPTLENSIISGNSCHYDGGGIFCCSSSTPVISNVTITGNSCIDWEGAEGGGISCWGANPVLNNVNLSDNFSIGNGGGISCSHNSSIIINDGIINRNIADWSGGGIWISNSSINLCGVTISENVTAGNGGGIYFGNNAVTVFDPDNRCNIYCNIDINDNIGNDLHANNLTNVDVIVDTFTVMTPNDYYVYPMENFTFDIQTGMIEPVNADLYVSPEGSNTNSGLTPDDPLKNINFAIQMVIADESNPVSIFLANGVYSPSQTQELFPIFTKDFVDIVGEDRENTILDAEETNRVIYAHEVTQSVKNLTTKNGSPYSYENGGGIFINDSDIELENLLITSNSSNYYGGGIYCNYSEPIFNNIRIENNSANGYYGTGGGIYFKDSNPILSSVTISHNYASNGGGIFFDNSNPVFDAENRCNIYNNSSEINYGNDLFARYDEIVNVIVDTFTVYEPTVTQINYPNNITIDIQNSIILPIDSDIFVSPSGSNENSGLTPDDPFQTISFALNSISSNAINPRNIYLDDGIYSFSTTGEQFPLAGKDHVQIIGEDRETTIVDGESIRGLFLLDHVQNFTLEKIQLLNGHTQRNYNYQYEHGGAINTVYSAFCLNNVIFLNNSAQYGGGVYSHGSDIQINNTNFTDNSAYGGGGIYASLSNIILEKVCFYNNSATSSPCAGIYNGNNSYLEVLNCTFTSNEAPSYYGTIYTRNSNAIIVNTICWNDLLNELCIFSTNNEQSTLTIAYSDIEGGEDGIAVFGNNSTINWLEGNIDSNPLFADSTNANFNLTENSPCIDAGTTFFEWEGEVILDMQPDEYFGSAPDMGAYESEFTGSEIPEIPIVFSLKQNYPNPFNPDTRILYSLPVDCDVNLSAYNIKGQKVRTLIKEKQEKGHHSIVWNGKDNYGKPVSSGIYFYKLEAGDYEKVKKMMLLK